MTGRNKVGENMAAGKLLLVPETQFVQCRAQILRYLYGKGLDAAFKVRDMQPAREIELARGSS